MTITIYVRRSVQVNEFAVPVYNYMYNYMYMYIYVGQCRSTSKVMSTCHTTDISHMPKPGCLGNTWGRSLGKRLIQYMYMYIPVGVPDDASSVSTPSDHNTEWSAGLHTVDGSIVTPQVNSFVGVFQSLHT